MVIERVVRLSTLDIAVPLVHKVTTTNLLGLLFTTTATATATAAAAAAAATTTTTNNNNNNEVTTKRFNCMLFRDSFVAQDDSDA